jgi:recombination protein RecT
MSSSTAVAERRPAYAEIRDQIAARVGEFANALPSHIKPEYFQRAALTAVATNPKLLNVDRRSLINSLMKCAQDGLIPDGREAALVIFKAKEGEIAQYLRMVGGIRKLVLQSGEITRFEQTIVYANDRFAIRFGDRPHIHHEPVDLNNRGEPIAVYSVAQFRDNTLSREIMTVEEIEYVRRTASRAAEEGPWRKWWPEMARKTVARRHAKILPMSTDVAAALERDETAFESAMPLPVEGAPALQASQPAADMARRPRLAETLDRLASSPDLPGSPVEANQSERPRRPRGRPKKQPVPSDAEIEQSQARIGNVLGEPPTSASDELDQTDHEADEPPGPPPDPRDEPDYDGPPERIENEASAPPPARPRPDPDYERGWRDAKAGARTCLNSAIKSEPRRHARWQAGHDAFHREHAS